MPIDHEETAHDEDDAHGNDGEDVVDQVSERLPLHDAGFDGAAVFGFFGCHVHDFTRYGGIEFAISFQDIRVGERPYKYFFLVGGDGSLLLYSLIFPGDIGGEVMVSSYLVLAFCRIFPHKQLLLFSYPGLCG